MSKTLYIVVRDSEHDAHDSQRLARLLDKSYTIVASWTTNNAVHHILTKETES